MVALIIKFVTVFGLFALFLTAFLGTSTGISGWDSYVSTLNAGPQLPTMPQAPTRRNFVSFATFYLRNYSGVVCPTDQSGGGLDVRDREPTRASVTLNASADPNNLSQGQVWGMAFDRSYVVYQGSWTNVLYFNVTPAAGPAPEIFVFGSVFWPDTNCVGYQPLFTSLISLSLPRAGNATIYIDSPVIEAFNATAGAVLTIHVFQTAGSQVVKLLMGPGTDSLMQSPGFEPIIDCSGLECVGYWAQAFVASSAFVAGSIIIGIVSGVLAAAWFFSIVGLFFVALFALSFSGLFGPASALIGIFTTVFLSEVVLFLVGLIRGTSGSYGL